MSIRAISTNKLATHPKYAAVLMEFNRQLKESPNGKVNATKFWREVVSKEVPNYSLVAWREFLRRFQTTAGLAAAYLKPSASAGQVAEVELEQGLLTNQIATQTGIQSALNAGALFWKELVRKYREAPASLTAQEQRLIADALFKSMKAQDSRIHALGKIREDSREQAKFDRAFSDAASD